MTKNSIVIDGVALELEVSAFGLDFYKESGCDEESVTLYVLRDGIHIGEVVALADCGQNMPNAFIEITEAI